MIKKNYILFTIFVIFLVSIDQYTKFFIQKNLNYNIEYFITNDIGFRIIKNTNIILTQIRITKFMSLYHFYILYGFFISFVIFVIILFYKLNIIGIDTKDSILIELGLCFLISSAIGNGIDKFIYHGVIDFIFFKITNSKLLVFNFADVFLVIAECFMIIGFILFLRRRIMNISN